jgi:hypothetical protein
LPVFLGSLLRTKDRRSIATWIPVALACVAIAQWFAGYFGPESRRPQWGFEYESANALSWLVPLRSGIFGDLQGIVRVEATGFQYEGYAYLGVGVLFLSLALLLSRSLGAGPAIRRHWVLFATIVGFSLLALSNHVYVGPHEVLSYPIPKFLKWIPGQFRSPGRFVWLPIYVFVCFVLHRGLDRFDRGWKYVLLAGCCVAQLVDARGDWALQRAFAQPSYVLGHQAQWRQLIAKHDSVFILPPYPCVGGDDGRMHDLASWEIQWVVSERALPINGTYAARDRRRCRHEARDWATLTLRSGALYVLLPQSTSLAERFEVLGAHCGQFQFGRVCSASPEPIAEAIRVGLLTPVPPQIVITSGTQVELASLNTNATWTQPENGGRWTREALSGFLFQLDGTPPRLRSLKLEARAALCERRRQQDVDVLLNGRLVQTIHFDDATTLRAYDVPIPPDL